ncbi:MAG TPA: DUF4175 family protein [Bacteroidota bacterium]|nr:DUF4175 family protein [Bacteroidota bacterium]
MVTSPIYTEILSRLDGVRKRELRITFLSRVLLAAFYSILLILLVVVLEQLLLLHPAGRTILFWTTLTAIAGMTGVLVGPTLLKMTGILKSADNAAIAAKVGKSFPSVRDRLLDALQMYEGKEQLQHRYSLALIDAAFADLYDQIRPLNFLSAVVDDNVRRARKLMLYGAALFVLVFAASPGGFFGSVYRIVHFGESFAAPQPVEFQIQPGNIEAVRGQDVPVTIITRGKKVSSIDLIARQEGQTDPEVRTLKADPDGSFHTSFTSLKASTDYYASVEDIRSITYTVTVLDRPLIRRLQLTVTPPSYTHLPSKILDPNTGDVTSYPGSAVVLKLTASKELSSAKLIFNDSTSRELTKRGMDAENTFVLRKNGSYHISLKDADGLSNIEPVEYVLRIIPDEYPSVEILSPGKNVDLTSEMSVDLVLRLKDDFGFSRLRLEYRLAESKFEKPAEEFTTLDIPLPHSAVSTLDVPFHWNLTPFNLVPEDAISYYAEVFDNDNVNGPKSGKSETYLLRVPSLEEVFSDASDHQQESMQSMQDAAKETESLKKDIEQMQLEMKKSQNKMDWQQQKKAEEMVQRYDALKKKLEDASGKLNQTVQKLEENKLLSSETMEKYAELQKLMEKLDSPELREALKRLQQSSKDLSPEEMQQAMQQLKLSEEQFRASIERTIELLKRIQIEQKVDEVMKRAEELKNQQEELRQQAANSNDAQKQQDLAKHEQDLQKQAEELEKEASELQSQMEEFPKEMPTGEMSKANSQLQQQKIGEKMNQSAQQIQSGDMQQSDQNQQSAEQGLQQFSDAMKQIQQSMLDKQMKQVVNEFKKQIQNMVELSKRQESLKENTRNLDPNSQRFRNNTEEQSDLMQDLSNVANDLGNLGKKTFAVTPEMGRELGNSLRQMNDAMQNMENRNPSGSSGKQSEAMSSLNRATMMMQGALSQMMQTGKSGMGMSGLMGQLGQMAGQQGEINNGTQSVLGQGQGLTPQQQEAYQRLATQQSGLQKSLKQLSDEAKNAGEYSKLLGDLDQIAQEMQEVQTDLEQGNVNPNTLKKEDHIHSRLLDSQNSMRERDYEKRRTSESGKDVLGANPPDLNPSTQEGKDRLRQELLKMLDQKYSKDYEDLIRKYFDELEKETTPR